MYRYLLPSTNGQDTQIDINSLHLNFLLKQIKTKNNGSIPDDVADQIVIDHTMIKPDDLISYIENVFKRDHWCFDPSVCYIALTFVFCLYFVCIYRNFNFDLKTTTKQLYYQEFLIITKKIT